MSVLEVLPPFSTVIFILGGRISLVFLGFSFLFWDESRVVVIPTLSVMENELVTKDNGNRIVWMIQWKHISAQYGQHSSTVGQVMVCVKALFFWGKKQFDCKDWEYRQNVQNSLSLVQIGSLVMTQPMAHQLAGGSKERSCLRIPFTDSTVYPLFWVLLELFAFTYTLPS